MNIKRKWAISLAGVAMTISSASYGFQFTKEGMEGSFDSTIAVGFGRRMTAQNCNLVGDPTSSCGASANVAQYSDGDNGNLNYNKGDFFTTYVKGTHELLLKMPDGWKFLGRGTWLYDFKATDTRRTDLESDAKDQLARDVRLLDLWVSKDLEIGGKNARLRVGNQVLNWGESFFFAGGINATNALDYQKLLIPGTQLKEAVLPAPMIDFATGLGHGLNLDVYYQFRWNRNRVPPVGSYFSVFDFYDKGREPLYVSTAVGPTTNPNFGGVDAASIARTLFGNSSAATVRLVQNQLVNGVHAGVPFNSLGLPIAADATPKNDGQLGIALHYRPEGSSLDLGFYYLNYHDKSPVLDSNGITGVEQWRFLENRHLYGVSANFPVGDWAFGGELSYRPKDAIALSGCFNPGGPLDFATNFAATDCQQWIDNKKYQLHLTQQLSVTPANYPGLLNMLGQATSATFTAEEVMIRYPGVSPGTRYFRTINGVPVMQAPAAGYAFWADHSTDSTLGYPITGAAGTTTSWGLIADFNWTYDGKIIPGWQVTPGITLFDAVKGDTPNAAATFLEGAKSANFYLLFTQNPTAGGRNWAAGLNYTTWWGGDPVRQPYRDRDFIGGFLSYNF